MKKFLRRKFVERQYNVSQEDLSKMSTAEIKYRLGKLSPELKDDIKKFSQFGVNYGDYTDNAYKARATHALMGELLKRDSKNRKVASSVRINSFALALLLAFSSICLIGYSNRGEKQKVKVESGIVTYSNGMVYSGFSTRDLNNVFNYSEENDSESIISEFLEDSFSGIGNLLFSNYEERATFNKALNDAEMLLKYSGVLSLDGVSSTSFHVRDMSLEEWRKLDLCIDSNVQSLCKIFTLGSVVEGYGEEFSDLFYKSIYYIKDNNKIYLNSKEDLVFLAGFSSYENYENFVMEVINTLNGNVFYYSDPQTSEYEGGIVLSKTI